MDDEASDIRDRLEEVTIDLLESDLPDELKIALDKHLGPAVDKLTEWIVADAATPDGWWGMSLN